MRFFECTVSLPLPTFANFVNYISHAIYFTCQKDAAKQNFAYFGLCVRFVPSSSPKKNFKSKRANFDSLSSSMMIISQDATPYQISLKSDQKLPRKTFYNPHKLKMSSVQSS